MAEIQNSEMDALPAAFSLAQQLSWNYLALLFP
jgi:hypothetical protein